jgi:hypothetical protein
MRLRRALLPIAGALACWRALPAWERPFRVYRSLEPYDVVELPPDYQEKTEWVFGRLMFPQHPKARFGRYRWSGGPSNWLEGGTSWTQDYPRADRHFSRAVRRLTRVHVRSVEQPLNPDFLEDLAAYPWMFAGEMGDWLLTDTQAANLREYLLRGGFLMLDDFWGTEEWDRFMESMRRVFPGRPVVEIEDADALFHAVYDLDERYQVPGQWALRRGTTYRNDGAVASWRGIYDDRGRLMVAMCFNNDIGDAWEFADDPNYPEKYSALAIRLGVNAVIYAMTH